MKYFGFLFYLSVFLIFSGGATGQNIGDEEQANRVEQLLARMSIEEKVGQMTQVTIDMILKDDSNTEIDEEKLRTAILQYHVGSILNTKGHAYDVDLWHEIITAIQTVATQESRSKIPVIYGIDAIHGSTYISGSTLFPHNIGMAATRNAVLVKKSAEITAVETRASGIPWNFDPVLDVGREALWPRFEETYGEDVHLVATMGVAAIEGYEQNGLDSDYAVASCMKHFLGYSVPASGKDRTPAYIPENMMREYFLPPFKAAVDAGVSTVMINSGEVNGVPVHGSKYFLTEILRDELGFQGVAVSDWEDVIRLHSRHKVASSHKEAVRIAVEAGLDMSMVPLDYSFYDHLVELVREGAISEERIDVSVRRILTLKQQLGLFDHPFPKGELKQRIHRPEYDSLALQASLESLTLLKNQENVLPMTKSTSILVAGPTAHSLGSLHGSWSYTWQGQDESKYPEKTASILEALKAEFGSGKVISRSVADFEASENYDIAQLKKDAKKVQAIILCLGENAYAESPGVIDDLNLDPRQMALAKAAEETGKPVVLVLVQGRPRIVSAIEPSVDAVLLAYRPSTFGASAIADVLSGDYNPNGVLPFTYPRHAGDIVLYDHKLTEEIREDVPNTYGNQGFNPQWTFGEGLSYTSFEFSDLKLNTNTFSQHERIELRVKVKNTGDRAGKKAVELYSRDHFASITPSARRLRAYTKVSLDAGEEQEVRFTIKPEDLAFVDEHGKWVTEPGTFDLIVGDLIREITYQETATP